MASWSVTSSPDSTSGAEPLSTSAFDYELPLDLIAHHPARERDASRLLVMRRDRTTFEHRTFRDIADLFKPGDVLVLNETRVIPARLIGTRPRGGEAEIVLLHAQPSAGSGSESKSRPQPDSGSQKSEPWPSVWTALVRPGAKLRPGRRVRISDELDVEILEALEDGTRRIMLHTPLLPREAIERYGRMPLPPYIQRDVEAADREQIGRAHV